MRLFRGDEEALAPKVVTPEQGKREYRTGSAQDERAWCLGVRHRCPASRQAVARAVLGPASSELGSSERENCPMSWSVSVTLLCLSFAVNFQLYSSPPLAAVESEARRCWRHITRTARPQLQQRGKSMFSIRSTGSCDAANFIRNDLERRKAFDSEHQQLCRSAVAATTENQRF